MGDNNTGTGPKKKEVSMLKFTGTLNIENHDYLAGLTDKDAAQLRLNKDVDKKTKQ